MPESEFRTTILMHFFFQFKMLNECWIEKKIASDLYFSFKPSLDYTKPHLNEIEFMPSPSTDSKFVLSVLKCLGILKFSSYTQNILVFSNEPIYVVKSNFWV